jgi:hypothetical protein
MKSSSILNLAAYLAFTRAAPTPQAPSTLISVTFNGAAGAAYTISVPLDGSIVDTNNVLSISTITSSYDIADFCTLSTVDYPPALVEGPSETWAVGPPQTVNSISCTTGGTPPSVGNIVIDFIGAGGPDAQYTLSIPQDGSYNPTSKFLPLLGWGSKADCGIDNVLSISTLQSSDDILGCTFTYVDGSAALVEISSGTWAVGPPQTIEGVSCS